MSVVPTTQDEYQRGGRRDGRRRGAAKQTQRNYKSISTLHAANPLYLECIHYALFGASVSLYGRQRDLPASRILDTYRAVSYCLQLAHSVQLGLLFARLCEKGSQFDNKPRLYTLERGRKRYIVQADQLAYYSQHQRLYLYVSIEGVKLT